MLGPELPHPCVGLAETRATGPQGGRLCRTSKRFQRTRSLNRNITTFPELDFSLFVRWGKRLVGFVTTSFVFYRIGFDG